MLFFLKEAELDSAEPWRFWQQGFRVRALQPLAELLSTAANWQGRFELSPFSRAHCRFSLVFLFSLRVYGAVDPGPLIAPARLPFPGQCCSSCRRRHPLLRGRGLFGRN